MVSRRLNEKKRDRCPICGGRTEHFHPQKVLHVTCRKCGCKAPVGVVRERDHEIAVVEWGCRRCGFVWSDWHVVPLEYEVGIAFWSVYDGCERCLRSAHV